MQWIFQSQKLRYSQYFSIKEFFIRGSKTWKILLHFFLNWWDEGKKLFPFFVIFSNIFSSFYEKWWKFFLRDFSKEKEENFFKDFFVWEEFSENFVLLSEKFWRIFFFFQAQSFPPLQSKKGKSMKRNSLKIPEISKCFFLIFCYQYRFGNINQILSNFN